MTNEELRAEVEKRLYKDIYRYIARDESGELFIFQKAPIKGPEKWATIYGHAKLPLFEELFLDINWKDEEPYEIPQYVDWSIIPVDTKVLVSNDGNDWYKSYFAGYKDDTVLAWNGGRTSWNEKNKIFWNYAKLAETK